MKYKIYEGDTVLNCLKRLLADGRRPATLKQIYDLKKKGKIKKQWYSTGTLCLNGEIKTVTLSQLKNIEEIYAKGGRLLYLGGDGIGYFGRFLAIKR